MNAAEMILGQPAILSPDVPLRDSDVSDSISEDRKKELAASFESILTHRILREMENTIGNWGFEKDGASRQVQGLFSLLLCDHIAKNGGLGLSSEIYESLASSAL